MWRMINYIKTKGVEKFVDIETFRKHGHEFIDWVADYYKEVEKYPVRASVTPGQVKSQLPQNPPLKGESMEKIFADFQEIILPGISHWQHPGWFAYFPANTSPPSILAEILTAGLGAQCMVWATSPAATELEEVVLSWLGQMLGLPANMQGVIQDTASTATLCALLSAREKASNFSINEQGFDHPLTVYASEEAHSSIEKDVKIAGFGKTNLRNIPTDENLALIPASLEEAIIRDKNEGKKPACVIATIGTTSSTAIDPLEAIGQICRRHNIWLHVDAAFAGAAAMLEEKREMLQGMEYVDSFVVNPHKWLLTNFDCSAYFVKEPEVLTKTFAIQPEYLKTSQDKEVKNFRDWGIQLGRRFRALKLWFVLRSYGINGLKEMLRNHLELAQTFKSWVEEDKNFQLMAPVNLSLICFRFKPEGKSAEELNYLNELLLKRINDTGQVFLTHTTLKNQYALRMAIGQRTTSKKQVQEAWDLIQEKAQELMT